MGKLELMGQDTRVTQPLRHLLGRRFKRPRPNRVAMTADLGKEGLPPCSAARYLVL